MGVVERFKLLSHRIVLRLHSLLSPSIPAQLDQMKIVIHSLHSPLYRLPLNITSQMRALREVLCISMEEAIFQHPLSPSLPLPSTHAVPPLDSSSTSSRPVLLLSLDTPHGVVYFQPLIRQMMKGSMLEGIHLAR